MDTQVFEIFGPVREPFYVIRFASNADITAKQVAMRGVAHKHMVTYVVIEDLYYIHILHVFIHILVRFSPISLLSHYLPPSHLYPIFFFFFWNGPQIALDLPVFFAPDVAEATRFVLPEAIA